MERNSDKTRHGASLEQVTQSTLWNLLGFCLPALVAIIAIPVLISYLGLARFGILGLITLLIGYMNLFDFGLGRAQTWLIADRLARDKEYQVPAVFWTSLSIIFILGIFAAFFCLFFADWLATSVLNFEDDIKEEVVRSFRLAAWIIPAVLLTPPLIGTLEAYQDFKLINLIRVPMGSFFFLGPLLVVPFFPFLEAMVWTIIAGRLIELLLYIGWCFKKYSILRKPVWDLAFVPDLFRFGSWMTVSNLIQPLMIHADRFLIGALRSASSVAFYTPPAEIVIKVLVLPRALVTVLFPNFTAHFIRNPEGGSLLYVQALRVLSFVLFFVALGFISFAYPAITLWLGPEFGQKSSPVLQWLVIGIFFLSLSDISQYLLQGVGKPKRVACIHMLELPFYVLLAYYSITLFGIKGAAIAWCIRSFIDFGLMFFAARSVSRLEPAKRKEIWLTLLSCFFVLVILAEWVAPSWQITAGIFVGCLALPLFWIFYLKESEKNLFLSYISKLLRRMKG